VLLKLFGMDATEYDRFHNFLKAHGCKVDYRIYRNGAFIEPERRERLPKVS
jgi:hypothetical protein